MFGNMSVKNVCTYNSMLSGYCKTGRITDAKKLFEKMPVKDVVSWNTMIIAFARNGLCKDAFEWYSEFRKTDIEYNDYTYSGVMNACVKHGDVKVTQQVHCRVFILGLLKCNIVIGSSLADAYSKNGLVDCAKRVFDEMKVKDTLCWTTLVHGYAKSGNLVLARKLFDEMPERNSISWTALIGGYAIFGFPFQALGLFRNMVKESVIVDQFTYSSVLSACAAIASLKHGKQIHAHLSRSHFRPNAIVLSSLVDMYSKCGRLGGGRLVFNITPISERDTIMWNTMMSAEGQHGNAREAVKLFEEMAVAGTKPDANTFMVILSACSHSGLLAEGVQFFKSMSKKYGVVPEEDHFCCLVDLLGRAGHLEEAVSWICKMRCESSIHAWNVLLGACKTHENMDLGKKVAKMLIELDPMNSAPYVQLSNIYAEEGQWECVEKLRITMEEKNVRKEPAESWTEF